METFTVTLEILGKSFPFTLCARSLRLGPAGPVSYYWIDGAALRRRPPAVNFRSCVDHWWAAMNSIEADTEIDSQVLRVWAECYPLVNKARSLQDVYLDAHLSPKIKKQFTTARWDDQVGRLAEHTFSLPADETQRLRDLAQARDHALIRSELEDLFLGPMPPAEEMPAYQEAAQDWLGDGILALRAGGAKGLSSHVATVGQSITKLRKRGGEDRIRNFINLFAYESKVAFYTCFANAWIDLIPWLREHRALDPLAERLLRLWHHQNQPGEDDSAGTGGNRDAFCGQVLSLHPLSAFVMNDPAHLQALGAWIAHPEHDRIVQRGEVGSCPAYWDVVATILIAAHEYKHVHECWDQTRSSRPSAGIDERAREATRDESSPPVATVLEDYAADRAIVCPTCGGAARFARHEPAAFGVEDVRVDFQCRTCEHPFAGTITATDFVSWLQADDV